MQRLLLYVHYNKFNFISGHVLYQLEKKFVPCIHGWSLSLIVSYQKMWRIICLPNSWWMIFLSAKNSGLTSLLGGMEWRQSALINCLTLILLPLMNDTCFGPLWDFRTHLSAVWNDPEVDFWGMTNYWKDKDFKYIIQSYYLSFKKQVIESSTSMSFGRAFKTLPMSKMWSITMRPRSQWISWMLVFAIKLSLIPSMKIQRGCSIQTFSYYNPTAILKHKVPFIKVKPLQTMKESCLIYFDELERVSDYPLIWF